VAVLSRARRNIEGVPSAATARQLYQPIMSLRAWWRGAVQGWANGWGSAPAK